MARSQKQFSYRQVTERAEAEIRTLMTRADKKSGSYEEDLLRGWAYGVYWGWYQLTCGWQQEGDNERLEALIERRQ